MNQKPDDVRPWGEYYILEDSEKTKVKRIVVNSGGRLSYQSHKRRSEYWVIVSGVARMTLDDLESDYKPGSVVVIPVGTKHRVENQGDQPLVFIEVQLGDYFGEDDIERFNDDYGRA